MSQRFAAYELRFFVSFPTPPTNGCHLFLWSLLNKWVGEINSLVIRMSFFKLRLWELASPIQVRLAFLLRLFFFVAWRIIPLSKSLITTIYKPFKPFGRETILLRGLTNNGYYPLTNWDDPPSGEGRCTLQWNEHILLPRHFWTWFSFSQGGIC